MNTISIINVTITLCLVVLTITARAREDCPFDVQPDTMFMDWSNPDCGLKCKCTTAGEIGVCYRRCFKQPDTTRKRRSIADCPSNVDEGAIFWNEDCGFECRCLNNGKASCPRIPCDPNRSKPAKYQK